MYTREISEIFHVGWPDPEWIRGFSVAIKPVVELDPEVVQQIMTTEDLPGIERHLRRNNFDDTHLHQLTDRTELIVVRGDTAHCGMPTSRMHQLALDSLNLRLNVLLDHEQ